MPVFSMNSLSVPILFLYTLFYLLWPHTTPYQPHTPHRKNFYFLHAAHTWKALKIILCVLCKTYLLPIFLFTHLFHFAFYHTMHTTREKKKKTVLLSSSLASYPVLWDSPADCIFDLYCRAVRSSSSRRSGLLRAYSSTCMLFLLLPPCCTLWRPPECYRSARTQVWRRRPVTAHHYSALLLYHGTRAALDGGALYADGPPAILLRHERAAECAHARALPAQHASAVRSPAATACANAAAVASGAKNHHRS